MANIEKLTREYGKVLWTGKKCILGMPISFTRYILTDTRLITRVGLLNLKEDEDSWLRDDKAACQGQRHACKGDEVSEKTARGKAPA